MHIFRKSLRRSYRGQGLVEYALILFLVAVVVIGALTLLGPQVGGVFSSVSNGFEVSSSSASESVGSCSGGRCRVPPLDSTCSSGLLAYAPPGKVKNGKVSASDVYCS
jgi:pilus assembly protein Flp/PilA